MVIDEKTISIEDIRTILGYNEKMAVIKARRDITTPCQCCGMRLSPGTNKKLGTEYIEATIFTTPVVVNPDKTNHIIIVDETMELLIDWNDK